MRSDSDSEEWVNARNEKQFQFEVLVLGTVFPDADVPTIQLMLEVAERNSRIPENRIEVVAVAARLLAGLQ